MSPYYIHSLITLAILTVLVILTFSSASVLDKINRQDKVVSSLKIRKLAQSNITTCILFVILNGLLVALVFQSVAIFSALAVSNSLDIPVSTLNNLHVKDSLIQFTDKNADKYTDYDTVTFIDTIKDESTSEFLSRLIRLKFSPIVERSYVYNKNTKEVSIKGTLEPVNSTTSKAYRINNIILAPDSTNELSKLSNFTSTDKVDITLVYSTLTTNQQDLGTSSISTDSTEELKLTEFSIKSIELAR